MSYISGFPPICLCRTGLFCSQPFTEISRYSILTHTTSNTPIIRLCPSTSNKLQPTYQLTLSTLSQHKYTIRLQSRRAGRDTTTMSAFPTNVQTPHRTSNPHRKPSSPSKAPKERRSTEHRQSSIFTCHSSDNSSPTSSSTSDLLSDAGGLSNTKSLSRDTIKKWTTSSGTAKSSSTFSSKGSAKKAKGSTTSRDEISGGRLQQYLSNDSPSAWSYING
jgi:hypothetical protein